MILTTQVGSHRSGLWSIEGAAARERRPQLFSSSVLGDSCKAGTGSGLDAAEGGGNMNADDQVARVEAVSKLQRLCKGVPLTRKTSR